MRNLFSNFRYDSALSLYLYSVPWDGKFIFYTIFPGSLESFTCVFYAYNKKIVRGNSIWQVANGFVAGGEAVLIHVDYGPVSMQVGALYAERLGYLLGRHVNRNVDRKVNLTL